MAKQEGVLQNFITSWGQVEIITGTLGKAFGGAIGGFTTGKKEIIELLRQRSRPYLFSNSIPPLVAAAGIKMVEMMTRTNELQDKLHRNAEYFISRMTTPGLRHKTYQISYLRSDAL